MNRRHLLRVFQFCLIATLILPSCSPSPTTPVSVPSAAPLNTAQPSALTPAAPTHIPADLQSLWQNAGATPPQIINYQPTPGEQAQPTADFEIAFDQPMNSETTQNAFQVVGQDGNIVKGSFSWPTSDHLVFQPAQPLAIGSAYSVMLDPKASSKTGVSLNAPFTYRATTITPLQVSQVFPADGVATVDSTSRITVMFNQPVVPLTIQEDQAKLSQPLKISPAINGKGEWINTSVYVFTPEKPLTTGTQFTLSIAAGLKDASGDEQVKLAHDFIWHFRTQPPGIQSLQAGDFFYDISSLQPGETSSPAAPGGVDLSPIAPITVAFKQAMDPVSTQKAISITGADSSPVPFAAQWDKANTVLAIKPLRTLKLAAMYSLSIKKSAQSVDGANLIDGLNWTFTTIGVPGIRSTTLEPVNNFKISFMTEMDPKTIGNRVIFKPELKDKNWYYNGGSDHAAYFFGLQPSTDYTITIAPGMRDRYGNSVNSSLTLHMKTDPLPKQANLNMPFDALFREGGPLNFYIHTVNVNSVDLSLYRISADDFILLQNNDKGTEQHFPGKDKLIWDKHLPVEAALDQINDQEIKLQESDGSPLKPGFYFLGMDAAQVYHTGKLLDFRSLIVTQVNLTFKNSPGDALVWATDPASGKPVAGIPLKVYNGNNVAVGSGKTDQDGILHVDIPVEKNGDYSMRFATTDSSAGGSAPVAFATSVWNTGVYPEQFGIRQDGSLLPYQMIAYAYTDRPLYRPGQPVYFKGIVRQDDDLNYKIPTLKSVEVVITNYEQEISRQTFDLDVYGAFNGQFKLDSEAALGPYTIMVFDPSVPTTDSYRPSLGFVGFTVAEYRKPEFQIDLSAAPTNLLAGESFTANLSARYYAGGGLDKAQVNWTLRQDPFTFSPPDEYSRFSFYDDSRDAGSDASTSYKESSKILSEGKDTTDADGKLVLKVGTGPGTVDKSHQLTLETTITDFAGDSVSAQAQVIAHKSTVYAGARSTQYVGTVGEDQTFELVALDWDGKPVSNQKLNVDIVRREWYSVQELDTQGILRWISSVKDVSVSSFTDVVTDAKGLASVKFTPTEGGVFRALAKTTDKTGHSSQSATYLWVAGTDFIPWRQSNDRTFQLIADRDNYKPGDTAELLIASPFQGSAYALVTVERGKVRSQKVLELTKNSTIYRLPVTADMAPGVFVSVIVVKGVDANNPRPSFKQGMTRLNVSTDQQSLKIDLTPDRKDAGPGDSVTYAVKATGADGKGVKAQVSLGLSDLATLSLTGPNTAPILSYFYGQRGLSVSTALSIVASVEDYNAQLNPNGANGRGSGGGGKGGSDQGVPEVRQNFPDTAFWKADVVTDQNGDAKVTVTLPDNLTTWRMDARAVTEDTHVGQTTVDLISSRPLLVRPQTPRFLVAGDDTILGAAVHNNTGKDLNVKVSLDARGVQLNSPIDQDVSISSGKQALVTWKAHVPSNVSRADLVFSAKGGDYQDASRPTLGTLDNQGIPIYQYEAPETVGTAGELDTQGARTEGIRLPDDLQVSTGTLKIQVEPSLAAGLTAGLDYLEHYPYECTEQTISRFLPNILTMRALQAGGIDDPVLREKLKEQLNTGLQKLSNHQNSDGGWGWWVGGKSDSLTSAYVMFALTEAKQAQQEVNQDVFNRGLAFLNTVSDTEFSNLKDEASSSRNRSAFLNYVLALAGAPNVSRMVKLYDQRSWLDLYAKGYLAQGLYIIDSKDPRLNTLRSELVDAATLSATGAHWQEHSADPWNWSTDTRSTAIVLDTLITIDPHNPINTNAVRWLMGSRKDGHWESTQETAWSLKTLTDWLVQTNELKANYSYAVALNGKDFTSARVDSSNVRDTHTVYADVAQLIKGETNKLVFARSDGPGSLYYTTHLTVNLPVASIKALDQGIILSRRYFQPSDLKKPVTTASQGDLLTVQLTMVVPNDLHYLVIEDSLPAGLEAVDTSLKSSPQNEAPSSYDWTKVGEEGWGWWYFTHTELRDEKVVLSTDYLPAGTYVYTYQVRASTPGSYQVIPPVGREFYFPEVYGRGDGSLFVVKP